MSVFKCKMCGGTIEFNAGDTVGVCEYCGSKQTLPRLDSDRKTNLYDRANHFRRNNEFDKAMSIYENILNEDPTDAEAYWSLVLCRYGIEYVEDPASHKRLPTVNRAQFTSIFDDEDYKSALQYADALQRAIYEDEAKAINEIQKGILEISAKEEPFDVFICYKETDANGRRTPDSVLATDLFHQLTNEGFKVFFSRITLEDKLGTAYEPYIFAALNSAKAMVVLGTKPEYFNATWVKNEWSRYLALIKAGAKKTLIPAYRDMDPYDLPDEFSHLQAQDMSKLGFMQDLIRGIKKLVQKDEPKPVVKETVVTAAPSASTAPLLRRAFMFLEDGEWQSADEYCEKVLDIEPENAEAYLGKLMAELKVRKRDGLRNVALPFDDRNNCQKAVRFGDDALKKKLADCNAYIRERNETARKEGIYQKASRALLQAQYDDAIEGFASVIAYKDAGKRKAEAEQRKEEARKDEIYQKASDSAKTETVVAQTLALHDFRSIPGWKDADMRAAACEKKIQELRDKAEADRIAAERKAEEDRIAAERKAEKDRVAAEQRKKKATTIGIIVGAVAAVAAVIVVLTFTVFIPNANYNKAVELYNAGEYEEAIAAFEALNGYKDSAAQIEACQTAIKNQKYDAAVALLEAEKYEAAIQAFRALNGYKDSATQIEVCETAIMDPKYEAALALYNDGQYEEAIAAFKVLNGYKDSTVQIETCKTAIKDEDYDAAVKLYNTGKYEDAIVAFEALNGYKDSAAQIEKCETGILDREYNETMALYNAGEYKESIFSFLALSGYKDADQMLKQAWDRVAVRQTIATGSFHTVGLKSDGTVIAVGLNDEGRCDVSDWSGIIAIAPSTDGTFGLKADGTVVGTGKNRYYVQYWRRIVAIAAGSAHIVGLKSDGTVVATGSKNEEGECDVSDWTNIVAITAGNFHTVGLKSDGTVVATKIVSRDFGQCDVSGWKNIVSIAAGGAHTVGLKSDGTVVAVGLNTFGQCDVSNWTDIVAIAAGQSHTVGLKSDGTVVAVGDNTYRQCNVSGWKDIVAVTSRFEHTVGLKANGTVIATGYNYRGECNVSNWKGIKIPE